MAANLYFIKCLTNLQVGNGDVNFNVIDNEVEKDSVTGYATMNASGVKGALREYFNKVSEKDVLSLFGGNQGEKTIPGAIKFMQADILAMPVRATLGKEAYYLVASEESIHNLIEKRKMLENVKTELVRKSTDEQIKAEGITLNEYVELKGKRIYIIKNSDYKKLMLPVVARNKLDNGKSENLWYEEVVPHHSIFTFYALADDEERMGCFTNYILDHVVQFGGGATVGYGFCKITAF